MKHDWELNEDGEINTWVWEIGHCNGPRCKRCGYSPCEHCEPDWEETECKGSESLNTQEEIGLE